MSCNYADGLSPYHDKGQLGLEERFDTAAVIEVKVSMLAKWINQSKHAVVHTGAGISTSAGIPDFRGPKGVWTLEAKGRKPNSSTDFNEAIPTATHMALTRLVEVGKVKYVVSQNIDGLHLRSGLSRQYLSELHGNMFVEQCGFCNRQFVRETAVPTVGQKNLQIPCPFVKPNGRACRGRMHDTILDWEHNLPENDLAMADFNSCLTDLSIALGTTMQIIPSGSLPLYTKKTGGKLVIINLQPTKHDTKADLLIRGYVDEVMSLLLKQLSLRIPKYCPKSDPTRKTRAPGEYLEWTITNETTAEMRRIYESKCGSKEAKKRLEVIDEDDIPIAERLQEKTTRKTKNNDSDSDLEVVAEIKKKRGRPRKNPIAAPPTTPLPTTKLTIKKNVTPNKTKYEIVAPRASKRPKVEIVQYSDDVLCDLEMVCESDNDDPVPITTNFRLYLENDSIFKREEVLEPDDVKKEEDEVGLDVNKKEDDAVTNDEKMDLGKLDEGKLEANDEKIEESKSEKNDENKSERNDEKIEESKSEADDGKSEVKVDDVASVAFVEECPKNAENLGEVEMSCDNLSKQLAAEIPELLDSGCAIPGPTEVDTTQDDSGVNVTADSESLPNSEDQDLEPVSLDLKLGQVQESSVEVDTGEAGNSTEDSLQQVLNNAPELASTDVI